MIKEKLPLSRLIDTHYADAAAKALGPFVLANESNTWAGCR
jgi:hypothetical protein